MRRDVCSNPCLLLETEWREPIAASAWTESHSEHVLQKHRLPSRETCPVETSSSKEGMDRSAKKLQYLMITSLVNSSLQRLILSLSLCFCGQPINCSPVLSAPLVTESHSTKWQVHSEGGALSYMSKTAIYLLSPVTSHHHFLAQSFGKSSLYSWALSSQHHSFWMVLYTNAQLLQQLNLQLLTEYLGPFRLNGNFRFQSKTSKPVSKAGSSCACGVAHATFPVHWDCTDAVLSSLGKYCAGQCEESSKLKTTKRALLPPWRCWTNWMLMPMFLNAPITRDQRWNFLLEAPYC